MGNTRVIRVPKDLMVKAKIADDGDVDIDFEGDRIVVRAVYTPKSRAAARKLLKTGGRE